MFSPDESAISIRDYNPSDFLALCALDRLCFAEGISYPPEEMALGLAQRGAFALVAEAVDQILEGRVAGFILAWHQRGRASGHVITIDIHPHFRRQGLGARLMQLAEQRLKASGATDILLEVAVENQSAIRFYEKRGYAIRRRLSNYYRDGSDAYRMSKILL
ncbi:MAG: GNAT family N-acetyltransferase [Acidobacteria bacterium]|nr:GNAT family N-acetyltransferase [Acidobacteriota bacterium]